MSAHYRRRRVTVVLILVTMISLFVVLGQTQQTSPQQDPAPTNVSGILAANELETLLVKGRAPKTDYSRAQFGDGWVTVKGCDTRNIILNRDLVDVQVDDSCHVTSGVLSDPYTGKRIEFSRGGSTSADVQIDHVVALSDAWQKGAQQLTKEQRISLANDALELLAVDGAANQQKSDGDAATWLPPYKAFRCQYVARQIAVKKKYALWVTQSEKDAMKNILASCPMQTIPID